MTRASKALLLAVLASVSSCKKEETTKAPLPRAKPTKKGAMASAGGGSNAAAASDEKQPLVSGMRDVPLDEIPRVTVEIDLGNCMGTGRWIDPKTPATPRVGAVSVAISAKEAGSTQPEAWIYEPVVNTATDGSVVAKGQHPWRLSKSSDYSIDAVAYNVKSSAVESKLSSTFDFKSTNDLSLKIVGTWTPSLICVLSWK